MTYDARCRISGWVVSALLHLCAVGVALLLVAEVTPPTDPAPFQWEVSLVEAVNRSDSAPPLAQPAEPSPTSPTVQQSAPPKPTMVSRQVHTRVETRVEQDRQERQEKQEKMERQVRPVVQQVDAVQEVMRQAIRPVTESAPAGERQPMQERTPAMSANPVQTAAVPVPVESATVIERVETRPAVVSTAPAEVARAVAVRHAEEPAVAPVPTVVERAALVEATTPLVDRSQSAVSRPETSVPALAAPNSSPNASLPETEPAPSAQLSAAASPQTSAAPPTPAATSVPAMPERQPPNSVPEAAASAAGDAREPVGRETDPVVAKSAMPQPAAKADYRWLAESLYRRIAELKRYPSVARLNGWEGKVVLRAVITADGNLADLRIQTSSGFDALDQAALEAVRQACPLHLQHALGRPQVVVSLPIVYSLSN